MKKIVSVILSLFLICSIFFGCALQADENEAEYMQKAPRIYYLENENEAMLMPMVTLYKNGNARLSQPLISSLGMFGIGKCKINGNELTVSHGENIQVVFTVSDNGEILTLKSTNLGFTKTGSVYRLLHEDRNLKNYNKTPGEKLTLDQLRKLAEKAPDLTIADFKKYIHYEINPDHYIFIIDGNYMLKVFLTADGETVCTVEENSSGERFSLNRNGSTGLVFDEFLGIINIPKYETRKWFDHYDIGTGPEKDNISLTLPEFPGITFTCTELTFTDGEKILFSGTPIQNIYLADLTNDGIPEFCATVNFGSGAIDSRIIVYDYKAGMLYMLEDRMQYDYHLFLEDGHLMVTQSDYINGRALVTNELQLINGKIYF